MGGGFGRNRFVPYVMMHEFEALLFSDCEQFGRGIGRPDLAASFQGIRDQFASPEEIDDSPETAPSKRVESLVAGYQKPLLGGLRDRASPALRRLHPRARPATRDRGGARLGVPRRSAGR